MLKHRKKKERNHTIALSERRGEGLTDLHIHTNASDGTWDTATLIKKLRENNIIHFSITDHDTFINSKKMLNEDLIGLNFVIGVEVSSMINQEEYHILAYDFDYDHKEFNDLLIFNQKARKEYDRKIIEHLKNKSIIKDVTDYNAYSYNPSRGGWDSLNYLIDKGVINHKAEFFSLIENLDLKPEFKDPGEVIEVIKKAGGTPILAHPTNYLPIESVENGVLDRWFDWGIHGIECYSPYLSQQSDADIFIDYCKEHDLLITSGSDCHGEFLNRPLGYPNIKLDNLIVPFLDQKLILY
ncbi:PHP domain-containing protein [Isachenkonia alkalipeptolytica]|uniref:PHP domain-containing protein n=1 Tax=Isachenkonia alkalipeptolytica TaxID=2565777 RepID=A0AA43XL99_9CLOT|nr:PHP domain-containing protein [Isachenkonia alkalipeptolytica]NBG88732.1 PHP domain-containing protein [Isachenkonia alkalipeptolytica]